MGLVALDARALSSAGVESVHSSVFRYVIDHCLGSRELGLRLDSSVGKYNTTRINSVPGLPLGYTVEL